MSNRSELNHKLGQEEINTLLNHFPQGVVAFDVETTGLSPWHHEIIEIAAVKLKPSGCVETFHQMYQPKIPVSQEISLIHGITNQDLEDSPLIETCFGKFVEFVHDMPLLAHNAPFDCGFLLKHTQEIKISSPNSVIFDSLIALRELYKKASLKPESFKLSSLAEFFKIELKHHQAMEDTAVTLKVFARALMDKNPNQTPGRLGPLGQIHLELSPELRPLADKFKSSIEDKTIIYIQYDGGSHRGKYRPVLPIALLPSTRGVALYAQCDLENFSKSFSLKRIKNVKFEHELTSEDGRAE